MHESTVFDILQICDDGDEAKIEDTTNVCSVQKYNAADVPFEIDEFVGDMLKGKISKEYFIGRRAEGEGGGKACRWNKEALQWLVHEDTAILCAV